jgi:(S)-citramalyl-CoA lyase
MMGTSPPQFDRSRRAVLFFPATRPDQHPKAAATGADVVCMDLEDAVLPGRKAEARAAAMELLAGREPGGVELMLRINTPRGEAGLRDLLALLESGARPDALMIPKVDSPQEVTWVEGLLEAASPVALVPAIETCRGLEAATEIVAASPRVTAMLFGGVDLSAELRCQRAWEPLLHARSRAVHAAAGVDIDVFDMPFLDTSDEAGLRTESAAAALMGFTGKVAIHPRQVEVIQTAFSPDPEEVERARDIVAAFEASDSGVLLADGRLIEPPVIRSAQRTLARAAAMEKRSVTP